MENNNHLVGIEKKALYEELQEEDYIKYKKLARHLEMVNLKKAILRMNKPISNVNPFGRKKSNASNPYHWKSSEAIATKQFESTVTHDGRALCRIQIPTHLFTGNGLSKDTALPVPAMSDIRFFSRRLHIPSIHPTYRPSSSASRNVASMFVYLAAWCVIQGIVIEKAWFQDHSSNFVIKVAVEGLRAVEAALGQHMSAMIFLQISLRKEKFFHRGWPQWLTTVTATAVRMEDARWNVLASNTTLGSAYDLFRPHPPLPLKLARTPDIPVGWYLPLSSSSTPTASSADSPAVADVATSSGAPSVGDKRKHVPDEDSGASMPPTKRFKGADVGPTDANPGPTEADLGPTEANPGLTEANPGLTEADPGIVGDEMEGVEHPLGDGDAMDIDAAVDGVERALNHDDAMDVDLDMDDLNERIRHRSLRCYAYTRLCNLHKRVQDTRPHIQAYTNCSSGSEQVHRRPSLPSSPNPEDYVAHQLALVYTKSLGGIGRPSTAFSSACPTSPRPVTCDVSFE
ncbi:hypothetical protein BS47DRAFT_1396447 [Hydnum rufescens UP504]|uniref:Uncharacterized protein n=1 Tax=Hydnum rufescens UP504 TaxID=1448309 RepID=A0A9P6AQB9_9AGAM|nr:hypothetical protein BS47DRAFT_1396447 [Hydnum rufescens UP504]